VGHLGLCKSGNGDPHAVHNVGRSITSSKCCAHIAPMSRWGILCTSIACVLLDISHSEKKGSLFRLVMISSFRSNRIASFCATSVVTCSGDNPFSRMRFTASIGVTSWGTGMKSSTRFAANACIIGAWCRTSVRHFLITAASIRIFSKRPSL